MSDMAGKQGSGNPGSDPDFPVGVRTVGRRRERPLAFSASADLLLEGAAFNDQIHRLPTGGMGFIPKGVFRFKTHEDANRQQLDCLARGMARIAAERS